MEIESFSKMECFQKRSYANWEGLKWLWKTFNLLMFVYLKSPPLKYLLCLQWSFSLMVQNLLLIFGPYWRIFHSKFLATSFNSNM